MLVFFFSSQRERERKREKEGEREREKERKRERERERKRRKKKKKKMGGQQSTRKGVVGPESFRVGYPLSEGSYGTIWKVWDLVIY